MIGIPAPFDVLVVAILLLMFLLLGVHSWKQNQEIKELYKENGKLHRLSTTDPLTGLKNRRAFDDSLTGFLALLPAGPDDKRTCRIDGLGLLMIDIDYFKKINDKFGHTAGDLFLKSVATSITKHVRSTDLVGRFGGEEFMVAVPAVTTKDLELMAEKLRFAISEEKIDVGGIVASVTVSIGSLHTKYYEGAEELVQIADKALYKAKDTGRNRVISHVLTNF